MPGAQPLLLHLDYRGTPKPTTREIASTVKHGGAAALTEAERRADARSAAHGASDKGSDGRPGHRRAPRPRPGHRLHDLYERADGGRRRVAPARAWYGASPPTSSRGPPTDRGGCQRRRVDGAH